MRLLALILLCGACARTPATPPEVVIRDAAERCEDLGFLRGSSDEASCVQRIFAREAAAREAALQRELGRF
ncbi:hypothetical protein CDV50_08965 [Haematobacter massiliensis]|uniref:Uncharacterized protein n=1 Tax=Haematobacter massiliensis TaxID=195105 RepID=A0A086YBA8_9RHOB|nr:hypothetical protein [Haematobacter massiliensis]KFI31558.1 hypothetical protein CN97_10705 [Haematobacter massiliensis]OWJ71638.1 hypothetical protein CDV50_08965 [Haematobacter massiliensis]OWJ88076.1 hypothetical protein CDV51_03045 [Haematobacter massiliensis]QBJ23542.1 hypothetical protein HmaOT1_04270 [Haematobacter massiliensis]